MFKPTSYSVALLGFMALMLVVVTHVWQVQQSIAEPSGNVYYVSIVGNDQQDGSLEHPWATINHAAEVLTASETVYLRGGTYSLTKQIRSHHSGQANGWITYAAFPGEQVTLDAQAIQVLPPSGSPPFDHDQGAFQLENTAYIRIKNLAITNSHNSGITVRRSHHIQLCNNVIKNTFSPGIGVWQSRNIQVLGNTIINANAVEMAGFAYHESETPHEALSLGSVETFEVAYNLVHHGQKEGIDIKETSRHGIVHHNYVHHMPRQGLYVDSVFGVLEDVEVAHNVVHACQGSGLSLSVEGGVVAKNLRIHHNLLYDNWGTGIFFSRWGRDGLRSAIRVDHNTIHHNGHGKPNPGDTFYWITGGIYLFSDRIEDVKIADNIVSDNAGFQIGYSDRYLKPTLKISEVFRQKQIVIHHNLIHGPNDSRQPIYAGWAPNDYAHIYGINGTSAVMGDPQFVAPQTGNFYLPDRSPANLSPTAIGAFPAQKQPDLWWQTSFPPIVPEFPQS